MLLLRFKKKKCCLMLSKKQLHYAERIACILDTTVGITVTLSLIAPRTILLQCLLLLVLEYESCRGDILNLLHTYTRINFWEHLAWAGIFRRESTREARAEVFSRDKLQGTNRSGAEGRRACLVTPDLSYDYYSCGSGTEKKGEENKWDGGKQKKTVHQ